MCDQQSLRPACAYAQSDQSLCWSLEYSMTVKLLTEHPLEFLSLKGGCTGSSESTLVKMPHCWNVMVGCLTGNQGATDSSLTDCTGLCSWAKHINPCLVLVQPRKSSPYITERLLIGHIESNQTNSCHSSYHSCA